MLMNLWVLFKNNIRNNILKKPFNFICMLIGPIVVLLIMSGNGGPYVGSVKVAIIDKDNSKCSEEVIRTIEDIKGVSIFEMKGNKDYNEIFQEDKMDLVLELKDGLENSIINYKDDLEIKQDEKIKISAINGENLYYIIDEPINSEIDNLLEISKMCNNDEKNFYKLVENHKKYSLLNIKEEVLNDLSYDYEIGQSILGLLIMLMFFKAFSVMQKIILEKYDNIYGRILTSSVKVWQYYLASILCGVVMLLLQILVCLIGIRYYLKIDIGISYGSLFVILFMICLVALSIGILSVCITAKYDNVEMFSYFITILFTFLGGCYAPIEFLPPFLQKFAYFIPITWAMDAIKKMQQGYRLIDIKVNIFIMALFTLTFFVFAVYRARKQCKVNEN